MTTELRSNSAAAGWELLNVLGGNGWTIVVTIPFAGDGILVIAEHQGHEIRRVGESVAAIAPDVFRECSRRQRLAVDDDQQLQLA